MRSCSWLTGAAWQLIMLTAYVTDSVAEVNHFEVHNWATNCSLAELGSKQYNAALARQLQRFMSSRDPASACFDVFDRIPSLMQLRSRMVVTQARNCNQHDLVSSVPNAAELLLFARHSPRSS